MITIFQCVIVLSPEPIFTVLFLFHISRSRHSSKSLVHGFIFSILPHLIKCLARFCNKNKNLTDRLGFKLTTNRQPTMSAHFLDQSPYHSNRWFWGVLKLSIFQWKGVKTQKQNLNNFSFLLITSKKLAKFFN